MIQLSSFLWFMIGLLQIGFMRGWTRNRSLPLIALAPFALRQFETVLTIR